MGVRSVAFAASVLAALFIGCGPGGNPPADSGPPGTDSTVMPTCGDGVCGNDDTENCTNCLMDCGACLPGCGDGVCSMTGADTCTMCPSDCGACPPCGDGTCAVNEDCTVCAADCGMCTTCGDGTCDAGEDCANCSPDCGFCPPTCGNGTCEFGENCSSCTSDCACLGCPNGTCDVIAGETCGTCAADCTCGTMTCQDALPCATGCGSDTVCLEGCYAGLCEAAQMQLQDLIVCGQLNCMAICASGDLLGCFGCIQTSCSTEFNACGTTC